MDSIFGARNFKNEVVWCYGGRGMSKTRFQTKHDIILFYGVGRQTYFNVEGASRPVAPEHVGRYNKVDDDGRRYARIKNRDGSYSNIYLKDVVREDWWTIPYVRGNEYVGYPTQKPRALLERIIKASSNPGDMVLDPFCGCATACVAAENLGRQWVGIDLSAKAADLVLQRLDGPEYGSLFRRAWVTVRTDIPQRTDIDAPKNYRTNAHVLFGQQQGRCQGCGYDFPFRNFTVDHVVPRSRGGSDHLDNLQMLCGACNSLKGDRPQEYLLAELKTRGHLAPVMA